MPGNAAQGSYRENLLDPDFIADPWPRYDAWRRRPGLVRAAPGGLYVVSRHADVARVLGDPRAFSSGRMKPAQRPWLPDDPFTDVLVGMDAPEHTAHRRDAAAAANCIDFDKIAALCADLGGRLLDALIERGEGDFVAEFAAPLQQAVIAETLGAPQLADEIPGWVEALSSGPLEPADRRPQLTRRFSHLQHALNTLLDRDDGAPAGGFVATLAARNARSGLGRPAALGFLGLWLIAAWETSIQLLANLALAWSTHPDACAAAATTAGRARLIKEVLRWQPPAHAIDRVATEAVELAGDTIPADAMVLAFVAAANRDPAVFTEPDSFDPGRDARALLSFGHGPHFCLGAKLAETQSMALARLLAERSVRLSLGETPRWRWTLSLRTMPRLQLAFGER